MPYNEGIKTFKAGAAIGNKQRVKIESGTVTDPPEVVVAGLGENCIGVAEYGVADGEDVAVKLRNFPGTQAVECVVAAAIARGTVLYGAAAGTVSETSSGTAEGTAMEAADATGDIIEVLFN